ncbi:MAG TPA: nucleotide pyrophosphohydrolase [Erysipelotrichaceae bacterium]|nr:nucleotide pyrophosphohydrolase [Erysipelotrichaceae bacterium]
MENLLKYIKDFNDARDWNQFHTPNNLAKSIVLEANELLESFQFKSEIEDKNKIQEELADVLAYCLDMCIQLELDPIDIVYRKYQKNAEKYPVEKVKGSSKKYNEY